MRGGSFKFHHCCIPIDSNTFLLATRAPSRDVRLINDLMNSLAATCNWPIAQPVSLCGSLRSTEWTPFSIQGCSMLLYTNMYQDSKIRIVIACVCIHSKIYSACTGMCLEHIYAFLEVNGLRTS